MAVPPLVEESLWLRAQEALHGRRTPRIRHADRVYPLRGLIWCDGCGRRFTGRLVPSTAAYRRYYACLGLSAAIEPELELRCRARLISADWLESVIAESTACSVGGLPVVPIEIRIRTAGEGARKIGYVTIRLDDGRLVAAVCKR